MSHRIAGAPLDFAALRTELGVPGDFASGVLDDARRAADSVTLPDEDATDVPLITIDPAGSRDLDQALHIAADGDGYLVTYAIADVAAFVRPGSPVDLEANRRGETLYFPDTRVPLHPPALSEGAASLLPGQLRPAVLWRIGLGPDGSVRSTDVRRARVRSVAQYDYAGMQAAMDVGRTPEAVALLPAVGERRRALARVRHAIDLDLPEQTVSADGRGNWTLSVRGMTPVERDNAEISLLTGISAAAIMLDAGIGILRTVPPPDERTLQALRAAAAALGIGWPDGAPAGDVLAGLDRRDPHQAAFIEHATSLLRGAGYTVFDGEVPPQTRHAGIGAPYAHVTAPLRRLVDRYGSEVCLAVRAGVAVPDWARAVLPSLPGKMRQSGGLAHAVDRAVVDATEAWLLRDRIGAVFAAVVVDAGEHAATIVLDAPAVRVRCTGAHLPIGERIEARLVTADVVTREVRFEQVRSDA